MTAKDKAEKRIRDKFQKRIQKKDISLKVSEQEIKKEKFNKDKLQKLHNNLLPKNNKNRYMMLKFKMNQKHTEIEKCHRRKMQQQLIRIVNFETKLTFEY